MSAVRHRAGLVVWLASLAAGLVLLHRTGGALAPPPLSQPGRLGTWLAGREPAEAAVSVVRMVAYATGWYLLAVTLLGALGRCLRAGRLVHASDLLTLPTVRGLLNRAVGLSMAATALSGSVALAAPDERPPAAGVEAMARLPDAAAPTSPPVTMRRLPDRAPPAEAGAVERLPAHEGAPGDATPPERATWTVRPGDHFWSVAERTLAAAWSRAPSDAETAPYWRQLVAANRHMLRDPHNPDLLFPGQVIVVPPASAAPAPSPAPR